MVRRATGTGRTPSTGTRPTTCTRHVALRRRIRRDHRLRDGEQPAGPQGDVRRVRRRPQRAASTTSTPRPCGRAADATSIDRPIRVDKGQRAELDAFVAAVRHGGADADLARVAGSDDPGDARDRAEPEHGSAEAVVTTEQLGWYVARARRMTPGEFVTRVQDEARRRAWQRRQVRAGSPLSPRRRPSTASSPRRSPDGIAAAVPAAARARAARGGRPSCWRDAGTTLGVERHDLVAPDWFFDPVTGRRAPERPLRVPHPAPIGSRDRQREASLGAVAPPAPDRARGRVLRHGRRPLRERVAEHLSSWWAANPFLTGVHWTSGIELGLRLIAWTWIRRLLDDWPAVADLFDDNDTAVRQLFWHQQYLAGFRSRGSSANNHVIAEAAGRLVAADAFPWFAESASVARRRRATGCSSSSPATRFRVASIASSRRSTTASSPSSRTPRRSKPTPPGTRSPTRRGHASAA